LQQDTILDSLISWLGIGHSYLKNMIIMIRYADQLDVICVNKWLSKFCAQHRFKLFSS